MAFEITIPRLGWSMEEGTFSGWLKNDGEVIRPGDVLFELEGEKALQEIEALDGGILRIPPDGPAPGSVLKVGALIGFLLADGEPSPWEISKVGNPVALEQKSPRADAAPAVSELSVAAPSVRRLARSLGVSLQQVAASAAHGRISEDDVRAAVSTKTVADTANSGVAGSSPIATPRAKKTAKRLGVRWQDLTGTGRDGRIRERDVLNAAGSADFGASAPPRLRLPFSGRRKVIAERLSTSARTTVPVTITTRAGADNLVSLRTQFKASGRTVVPAYHDIITKLVADCLKREPLLAARLEGDEIVLPDDDGIHIGLAVDTPQGLVVPVLGDVLHQTLPALAVSSARIVQRAREGRLAADEMHGAVFTITNLGGFGIDAFTPVINLPESAILGLGSIRKEPVVTDDERIVVGQVMTLSLTFDHRIIDGAPAARFLQSLVKAIENPAALLLAGADS